MRRAARGAVPAPMLAQTAPTPFTRAGWLFEIKLDGVRALIDVRDGHARVFGRSGAEETARYPEAQELVPLAGPGGALFDAEIIVLDQLGRPSFARLQPRIAAQRERDIARLVRTTPVSIAVFDLLRDGSEDITAQPLMQRKQRLAEMLAGPPAHISYVDHVETDGEALFTALQASGLEGMIAKRADSPYQPGARTGDWVKIKAWRSQTCAVVGFTKGSGSRAPLGALVIAVRDGTRWRHAGSVGSGFSSALVRDLRARLDALRRDTPPVTNPPPGAAITWVRPEVYCEVRHAGFTDAGVLRHPVLLGMRDDVGPADCVRVEAPGEDALADATQSDAARTGAARTGAARTGTPRTGTARTAAAASNDDPPRTVTHTRRPATPHTTRVTAGEASEAILAAPGATATFEIDGLAVHLTNLDKPMWPGIPKRRLIAHYVAMAPWLLPHLAGRAVNSQIFPDGIDGKSFWRKDVPGHAPEWLTRWKYASERRTVTYVVADSAAALAWLANSASIDLHPWHSRIDAPDRPDWAVFDLDPAEQATFEQVRTLARLVKVALDHLGLRGYLKTSGQTGLQIYVPVERGPGFAEVRGWVEEVSRAIGRIVPDLVSWEWEVARRTGRVRMDYTQNILNKTLAAPYSLRPGPGAPVSTPLTWDELEDPGLRPDGWTIDTIGARVASVGGDLFAPVLRGGQTLPIPGKVKIGQT